MAGYDKAAIVKEYEDSGKPPYSTFHKERAKDAKARGDDYPALMTLKKWLVEAGLLDGNTKEREGGDSALVADGWRGDDFEDFLLSYLPETVKHNLENCYLKWQNKKLKDELAKAKEDAK